MEVEPVVLVGVVAVEPVCVEAVELVAALEPEELLDELELPQPASSTAAASAGSKEVGSRRAIV